MKVLVSGSAGFIGGYLVQELLSQGFEVVGLDDLSKYGEIVRSYGDDARFRFVQGDAKDVDLLTELLQDCDHFAALAARIGGIGYFHEFAYDLLAENERITAAAFDAAIRAHRDARLTKITVLSSSMVYENATVFPTPEGHQHACPPPTSTYGFQKLACEYFAVGAWQQYQLPYTICRPFNCVGIGERRAARSPTLPSGNLRLALGHVLPDLAQKMIRGQNPLRILGAGNQTRCYTYGGDLARGIVTTMTHPAARNEDFNLSTPVVTSVLELAERIWKRIHGPDMPFRYECDASYPHDVQTRVPDVSKAERLLGFRATTDLDRVLDEVLPWVREEVAADRL